MSIDCSHGSFGEYPHIAEHGDCPECRMARIEALLERIATAVAPTEADKLLANYERGKEALQKAQTARPVMTNAIGGPQTGRGVR